MMARVVITGMGAISPVGLNLNETWTNMKNGVNGIASPTAFDPESIGIYAVGEVKNFDPEPVLSKREAKRLDRFSQLAQVAADEAVKDADFMNAGYAPEDVSCILGSGMGGITTILNDYADFLRDGYRAVSPFFIPKSIINLAAGNVAIRYGLKGPCYAVVTACASSTDAIGQAYLAIKYGRSKAALAGGAEATVLDFTAAGFGRMQALSTNKDPNTACRPFDKDRDGFVMGEGAAFLVLEDMESAVKRGAKIIAEVAGYGQTCDAYHITAPHPEGEGAANSMLFAVKEAGVPLESVGYINAHGTSTPLNDALETKAILKVFGEHAKNIGVGSTKSMTGHLLGAAGALEAVITAKVIGESFMPPTIGLETEDEVCTLDYIKGKGREKEVECALSNSFGFGGHNGTLLIKKV
ncbi:MAG TPA: beta-ketoacyl-ACP synthase II [Armatimonadota bacterium]|nr:beta-ketoacyl-ACP synthase II [Armatimonadota bacterium]